MADALTSLRYEIEEAGTRPDLSPADRNAKLRVLEGELRDLIGLTETYSADNERERETVALHEQIDRLRVRHSALVADELVERGLVTPEQVKELGLLSEADLEKLIEEGLLGRLGQGLSGEAKAMFERQHLRGRGGEWKEMPDVATPPSAPVARAKPKVPEPEAGDVTQAGFEAQRKALEQRTREHATRRLRHASPSELHFNQAGKVSQATLGNFARLAVSGPDTTDRYSALDEHGNRVWNSSRKALHDKIVDIFLRQRRWDPEGKGGKGDWVLCEDCPYLDPPEGEPQVLFSGGGYATGKSSVLKLLRARGEEPDSGYEGPPLVLDPDQIKALMPEFQQEAVSDPATNARVYREAWEISQEVQRQAQQKRLNIVVDGISNTSPDEFLARVDSFHKAGYGPARVAYTDIATEEAIKRAAKRARDAVSADDRRMVPEVVMRAVSRDVSAMVPDLAEQVRERGVPLSIEVYDNDQGQDENGQFRPPKRFFSQEHGSEPQVEDPTLWSRFKAKRHEDVIAPEPVLASPAQETTVGNLSDAELAAITRDAPTNREQWSERERAAFNERRKRGRKKSPSAPEGQWRGAKAADLSDEDLLDAIKTIQAAPSTESGSFDKAVRANLAGLVAEADKRKLNKPIGRGQAARMPTPAQRETAGSGPKGDWEALVSERERLRMRVNSGTATPQAKARLKALEDALAKRRK